MRAREQKMDPRSARGRRDRRRPELAVASTAPSSTQVARRYRVSFLQAVRDRSFRPA